MRQQPTWFTKHLLQFWVFVYLCRFHLKTQKWFEKNHLILQQLHLVEFPYIVGCLMKFKDFKSCPKWLNKNNHRKFQLSTLVTRNFMKISYGNQVFLHSSCQLLILKYLLLFCIWSLQPISFSYRFLVTLWIPIPS